MKHISTLLADRRLTAEQREAAYIEAFIEKYRSIPEEQKGRREAECLLIQHCYAIQEMQTDDLLLGRYIEPSVGFAMQDSGMGYYLNEGRLQKTIENLSGEEQQKLEELAAWWRPRTGREQLVAKTPAHVLEVIPTDRFHSESNVGFWLCRMSSTQLDFDKLLRKGIAGLKKEITVQLEKSADANSRTLYQDMIFVLDQFTSIVQYHAKRLLESNHPRREELSRLLNNISVNPPVTFHEAVQLMYLYALVSGTYNYGRLDEYLGDLLAQDLNSGRIRWDDARQILVYLWRLMIQRKTTWNGRVIIGGLGRRNEQNADQCAKLVLEVADIVKDVLPQLTLRFHSGQNPELYDRALRGIGRGNVYPLLYNDEVNIPSVENAFRVTHEEAIHYLPFGCGEYILYHRSVGTPSDVINLLKALEITIFNGYDHLSGKQIGLKTGEFESFETFEAFYDAYCRQVER